MLHRSVPTSEWVFGLWMLVGEFVQSLASNDVHARWYKSNRSAARFNDWPDHVTWLNLYEAAFTDDPELAETISRVWYDLLESLADGPEGVNPEGINKARSILKEALKLAYPFTQSYRLAFKHIRLSLSGQVDGADEPRQLLKASIKRARAQVLASRQ